MDFLLIWFLLAGQMKNPIIEKHWFEHQKSALIQKKKKKRTEIVYDNLFN